jgi:beta-glucosidase
MTDAATQTALEALTLDEKALLVEGVDAWRTNAIPRLGIPSLFLTDGPHGVRKVREAAGGFAVSDNELSTAFPTAASVANSWNPENAFRMAEAIGREARDAGVDVVLATGVNIKRSPLCGRNFEYYSEDPLVSGVFGSAFVRGLQSVGVGASVKHFAANSNENFRFVGDSLVDERALREIYLRAFERVVTEASPWTVMCAYNKVNGVLASENRELLTTILRDEWGFDGLVMTDWGATRDRVAGVAAGCDLDMPGQVDHNRRALIAAVSSGALPVSALDASVERMLRLVDRVGSTAPVEPHAPEEHAELSRRIASEGAVLLTNDGTLPLPPDGELLVVWELFENLRFQGAGSSLINPPSVVSTRGAFDRRGVAYRYESGAAAVEAAKDADIVLLLLGLTDFEESEGFDREHLRLDGDQLSLAASLIATGARVVVVLFAGAPVELPFADDVAAILHLGLPGMRGGEATADLLFGDAVPSGKLAESWPLRADDSSAAADYNRGELALYSESIYVGYRSYDKAGTALRFPFGHGLSYTTFAYRDLAVTLDEGVMRVRATVANTGARDGVEVVQLYVRNNRDGVFKADKELRAFARVFVAAGAEATAELEFALADLAYWDVARHGWVLENGEYEVLLAASAADIRLSAPLPVTTGEAPRSPYSSAVEEAYAMPPVGIPDAFAALLGRDIPQLPRRRRLTLETRLTDARHTLVGKIVGDAIVGAVSRDYRAALRLPASLDRDAKVKNAYFVMRMMPFSSMRSLAMASAGAFHYDVAAGFADIATGHPIRGLRRILNRPRKARA